MDFPYGKAPLAILILALVTGAYQVGVHVGQVARPRPDIIMATFTKEHADAYLRVIPEFERRHGVKIQLQVVDQRALQDRLRAALQAGAEVPDMVELLDNTMGIFAKGPLEDVGFVDLTDLVRATGLDEKVPKNRFSKWSSRGRIFALPHDIHPTMLAYRRDIVEDELGIDVSQLTTWEKFCQVGRQVTRDLNGDGVPDRYMIDLPVAEGGMLRLLLLQRGGRLFDETGRCAFDSPEAVDVITWYVRQVEGPERISFPAGWGQNLARAMIDGLCLFYVCPDWRTRQFEMDVPSLAGKMKLMPMPAWEEGGLRTTTWGATGLAITRQCMERGKFELAWKLAMYLYYDPQELGRRFAMLNILPPLVEAWNQPEIFEPRPFWSGQPIGQLFAQLAPDVPAEESNAYMGTAENKLLYAYTNTRLKYKELLAQKLSREELDRRLREYAQKELTDAADSVRRIMSRNVFLQADWTASSGESKP